MLKFIRCQLALEIKKMEISKIFLKKGSNVFPLLHMVLNRKRISQVKWPKLLLHETTQSKERDVYGEHFQVMDKDYEPFFK